MTTEAAAREYLAKHMLKWGDSNYAIYNPDDKKIDELPTIYGFNNGGNSFMLCAQLLAEDGTALGSHGCSHEGYMRSDLGILHNSRSDRHELFRKHYPDGYKMEFVPYDDIDGHVKLNKAFELNKAQRPVEEPTV